MNRLIIPFLLILLLASCLPATPEATTSLGAGIDIVGIGDTWIDGGCELTLGNETYDMTTTTTVDTAVIGETAVIYTHTLDDTTYRCERIVKVIDDTSPTLTLLAGLDTIAVGDTWVDAGVTVSDEVTSEPLVQVDGTVDTTVAGTYTVTYTATDEAGNVATIVRVVTVTE